MKLERMRTNFHSTALQERYDLDVTRRALLAEAQRKEREEEAARAAGEQVRSSVKFGMRNGENVYSLSLNCSAAR